MLSISDDIEDDAKAALLKLEAYLDTLIDHIGLRKARNLILNYCTDTIIIRFSDIVVPKHEYVK